MVNLSKLVVPCIFAVASSQRASALQISNIRAHIYGKDSAQNNTIMSDTYHERDDQDMYNQEGEVEMENEQVDMENDHVEMENDHVEMENDQVDMENDQVDMENDHVEMENDQEGEVEMENGDYTLDTHNVDNVQVENTDDETVTVTADIPERDSEDETAFLQGADRCKAKLAMGMIPEARTDAPLSAFGYPQTNFTTGKTILNGRAPLNLIQRFKVPIKVGSQDYLIQGNPHQIQSFLKCFRDYEVIASHLGEDGHWKASEDTCKGTYIQLQNVSEYQGDVIDIMFKYTLDRVLRELGPSNIILDLIGQAGEAVTGGAIDIKEGVDKYKNIKRKIKMIREYINISPKELKSALEEAKAMKDPAERIKHILKVLANVNRHNIKKSWEGLSAINGKKPLILSITSYPKPGHNVRATYSFNSCTVSMADIAKVYNAAITKTAVGHKLDFIRRELKSL